MSGPDGVLIKYTELSELNRKLKDIVAELEGAEDRADVLEDAIGDPYGKNRLREAVEDFEDRWNNKRKNLAEDTKKVQEHVQGVLDGFTEWDRQTTTG
ncbi:hypothetical protein [Agromyces archimandritae]|uniref:Flagellar protein FlgN n=1 Tax=Agromyces archimandritae TaxID=2781962 RepID=A0A975FP91_9MICO|nr:hypothetical protein [Agromyces archimandritae]QTX05517.1 hypothetical protein G127AT_04685 [Agromyces archimandritae]